MDPCGMIGTLDRRGGPVQDPVLTEDQAGEDVRTRSPLPLVMQKGSTRELLKGAHAWAPLLEPLKQRTDWRFNNVLWCIIRSIF